MSTFDEEVGLGEVATGGPGGGPAAGRYRFHCTQIANGTRVVEVGARVSFRVLAGRDGRWEAGDLQQVDAWDAPSAPDDSGFRPS